MLLPLNYPNLKIGGGERVRTDDLLLAKQVLSQLSYAPEKMVGLGRLELPTSRLSGVRSNQAELQARTVQKPPRNMNAICDCMRWFFTEPHCKICFEQMPTINWLSKGMRRRRSILALLVVIKVCASIYDS